MVSSFCQVATLFVLWGEWKMPLLYLVIYHAHDAQDFISSSLAMLFICYGRSFCFLHVSWSSSSSRRKRGTSMHKSNPRQCMSGIVILMLTVSTAYAILSMKFYIMQIPSGMAREPPPGLLRRLLEYDVALCWLSRLNVSGRMCSNLKYYPYTDLCASRTFSFALATLLLSGEHGRCAQAVDLFVVYSGWLWPLLQVALSPRDQKRVLTSFKPVCTTTNLIMITVDVFQDATATSLNKSLFPRSNGLRAVLYIPLMATNVLATTFICYKSWYMQRVWSHTCRSSLQMILVQGTSQGYPVVHQ